jgi:hypothetical protein
LHSLKAGKAEADDRVERSLYQRAVGYRGRPRTFKPEYIEQARKLCALGRRSNAATIEARSAASFAASWRLRQTM